MKGSLFILSIILLLESIVLFGLGGGLAVNAVLFNNDGTVEGQHVDFTPNGDVIVERDQMPRRPHAE